MVCGNNGGLVSSLKCGPKGCEKRAERDTTPPFSRCFVKTNGNFLRVRSFYERTKTVATRVSFSQLANGASLGELPLTVILFKRSYPMISSTCLDASHGRDGIPSSPRKRMTRQDAATTRATGQPLPRPLNRLRIVREQQGLTLRTISRRSGVPVRQLRGEEEPHADLPASALQRWQQALEVPMCELLVEPDDHLSVVVEQRAKLLRVMKTALSVRDTAKDEPTRRLGTMLCAQLQELMPELSEQTAWPTVGSRRSHDDIGKIAENPLSVDWSELI